MNLNDLQELMKTPLGQVVERVNQVFWVCSIDLSQVHYVSPAYEQIWGRSTASLYENSESFTKAIYPDDREYFFAAIKRLQQQKQVMDEEYRITRPDGSIRWIHNRAIPSLDATGEIQYLTGIAEDITQRKEVETVLAESEQKFLQFANSVDIVFWVCAPDASKFFYISPGYEKIWGKSCASIYSNARSFIESVHPDDLERVIAAAIGENACYMDEEYRIIRPDGTVRWVRDRTFPVYNEHGEVFRMAGIAQDVTQRKLAEEEIYKTLQREHELSEAKSQFIATTSHEIRTPLTTIQSSIDMLQHYTDRLTNDQKQAHFQKIESAVQNIKQIVHNALLLSESEAGTLQLQLRNVDIVAFCQEIIATVSSSNDNQKRIKFTISGDTSKPLSLDPKLINYIVTNLLENALKYSLPNSIVKFELCSSQDQVILSIQDQGIGIPQEDLPQIFGSFYRSKNIGKVPGTGLGLSIVKQCVDLHKGKIDVNSIVGEGTTFTVRLPNCGIDC
ncbi:PAS domain-containing sensor histidine kinase [Nostocales cyanobacterium HT-58-2]|nr:PAS domain-containing sensor histidine kinase [Nostocales cyanobacterium HT-58-2]